MRTIDLTPTWAGVMPILLEAYEHGEPEGRKIAREELMRLAQSMDEVNARSKETAHGDKVDQPQA
jgi:hypothetical protein